MKYRRLGGSGLKVSEISLGSWLTYGGYVERENAVNAIKTAYDLGINFFDTANVYEKGAAEELVGKALKAYPRESYVLATKAFWPMGEGPNDRGLSRKHIIEQANASLKRLGHEYVDIFYCHRHDPETPIQETLRALDDLVRQGKVLYVGVSEWQASQIAEALGVADRYLLDRIVVNQPIYNMFERYIEKEIMPLSERSGIGQVVFSPLAQGLLTGKYTSASDIPTDSRAAKIEWVRKGITDERIKQVQQLEIIADELGISVGNLALAWILRNSNVASALVGASRPEQVTENAKASGIQLSEDILKQIEDVLK
ncbi:aldo/keto reductase family protein [Paenibacillus macquariensis]|uniref:Voltage-dependent potassium channel beta subunit, animal n=1 Tax=Paenibacillus macquariensis TaxID=948756 RepID=A0ABY1JUB0_9BACL|nr:aldo/keto reductase family protein [Paenibacillus macquariensis]MEC0091004.1 aldo/keto reductase family protein [Paenibacillus macquariensis]OAB34723.1 voltage-gated potassium channel [Paenibacillus macquariensis subsp. macquariensis]SIQ78849.1 voltage-dependent potassium channel beta subunit, animal [Paenibacillus macquariensis]